MSEEWRTLAAQIASIKAENAQLRAEVAELRILLAAADTLRNHDRGLIVAPAPDDVINYQMDKRK